MAVNSVGRRGAGGEGRFCLMDRWWWCWDLSVCPCLYCTLLNIRASGICPTVGHCTAQLSRGNGWQCRLETVHGLGVIRSVVKGVPNYFPPNGSGSKLDNLSSFHREDQDQTVLVCFLSTADRTRIRPCWSVSFPPIGPGSDRVGLSPFHP